MTQSLHPEIEVMVSIKWAPEPGWKLWEKINIPEAYLDPKFLGRLARGGHYTTPAFSDTNISYFLIAGFMSIYSCCNMIGD